MRLWERPVSKPRLPYFCIFCEKDFIIKKKLCTALINNRYRKRLIEAQMCKKLKLKYFESKKLESLVKLLRYKRGFSAKMVWSCREFKWNWEELIKQPITNKELSRSTILWLVEIPVNEIDRSKMAVLNNSLQSLSDFSFMNKTSFQKI